VLLSTPISIGAVRGVTHRGAIQGGEVLGTAITHTPYHYIRIMPLNINHVLIYRARSGEQNKGTRSVIGSPHKAIGVNRVL
jgi:hypothetical protein